MQRKREKERLVKTRMYLDEWLAGHWWYRTVRLFALEGALGQWLAAHAEHMVEKGAMKLVKATMQKKLFHRWRSAPPL